MTTKISSQLEKAKQFDTAAFSEPINFTNFSETLTREDFGVIASAIKLFLATHEHTAKHFWSDSDPLPLESRGQVRGALVESCTSRLKHIAYLDLMFSLFASYGNEIPQHSN